MIIITIKDLSLLADMATAYKWKANDFHSIISSETFSSIDFFFCFSFFFSSFFFLFFFLFFFYWFSFWENCERGCCWWLRLSVASRVVMKLTRRDQQRFNRWNPREIEVFLISAPVEASKSVMTWKRAPVSVYLFIIMILFLIRELMAIAFLLVMTAPQRGRRKQNKWWLSQTSNVAMALSESCCNSMTIAATGRILQLWIVSRRLRCCCCRLRVHWSVIILIEWKESELGNGGNRRKRKVKAAPHSIGAPSNASDRQLNCNRKEKAAVAAAAGAAAAAATATAVASAAVASAAPVIPLSIRASNRPQN